MKLFASPAEKVGWAGYIKSYLWAAQFLSLAHEVKGNVTSTLTPVNNEHVSQSSQSHLQLSIRLIVCVPRSVPCRLFNMSGACRWLHLLGFNPEKDGEIQGMGMGQM